MTDWHPSKSIKESAEAYAAIKGDPVAQELYQELPATCQCAHGAQCELHPDDPEFDGNTARLARIEAHRRRTQDETMSKSNQVMTVFLDDVKATVTGPRQQSYGLPEVNHLRTATLWNVAPDVSVSPAQVCILNALQKLSREFHAHDIDNLRDACGFIANAVACYAAELPVNGT